MVKDLFERIQNNKGPLEMGFRPKDICFPKLEGELGPRMQFGGKVLNGV
jgi:glycine C-acetyltransferase